MFSNRPIKRIWIQTLINFESQALDAVEYRVPTARPLSAPKPDIRPEPRVSARTDVTGHTDRPSRVLICSRNKAKSIGLVSKPSAPLSIALRLVSSSP